MKRKEDRDLFKHLSMPSERDQINMYYNTLCTLVSNEKISSQEAEAMFKEMVEVVYQLNEEWEVRLTEKENMFQKNSDLTL